MGGVKIGIIIYSMYGHTTTMARALQKGIVDAGGIADIYRVEETSPEAFLKIFQAQKKPFDVPIATSETLLEYDAFLFGNPTRFGTMSAQWAAFWDNVTIALWRNMLLHGKPAGLFVSTGFQGGGQEICIRNCISTLVHHGMIYVPLGYKDVAGYLSSLDSLHGGSAWGSGCYARAGSEETCTALEIEVAEIQGRTFYQTVKKFGSNEKVLEINNNITNSESFKFKPVNHVSSAVMKKNSMVDIEKSDSSKKARSDQSKTAEDISEAECCANCVIS